MDSMSLRSSGLEPATAADGTLLLSLASFASDTKLTRLAHKLLFVYAYNSWTQHTELGYNMEQHI